MSSFHCHYGLAYPSRRSTSASWGMLCIGSIVRNVNLADTRITGYDSTGGIVLNFEEEGTPTGVGHTEITESTEMADAIYDLQGRRIEKPKKGLYIVITQTLLQSASKGGGLTLTLDINEKEEADADEQLSRAFSWDDED